MPSVGVTLNQLQLSYLLFPPSLPHNTTLAKIAEKQYILIPMLQSQQKAQAMVCPDCLRQQDIIQKYAHLVSLLKKKTQRREDSKLKDVTGSQITIEQLSIGYALRGQTLSYLIQKLAQRRMKYSWDKISDNNKEQTLAFIASQPAIEAPLKQKGAKEQPRSLEFPKSCLEVLKECGGRSGCSSMGVSSGDFLEELFKSKSRDKVLLKKIYSLQLQNSSFRHRIVSLESELSENVRRQEKEIAKKRESLQGLADELLEKNDVIEDLKETIKSLQNKLLAKDDKAVHRMLEEDGDSMRRVVFKLENINDKLNHDISRLREEKTELQSQNKSVEKTNEELKAEIKRLKEDLFNHEHEREQTDLLKHELELVSSKMTLKLDKIKKLERKLNEFSKVRDSVSTDAMDSSKKVAVESTINVLTRSEEMKEMEMDNKLESVFTFLFNIQNQDYQLHSTELFDDEEKQLLKTHKSRFLNLSKAARDDSISPACRRFIEDKENVSHVCFGQSLLDAFEEPPKTAPPDVSSNMKLIALEIERNKLIEKVSELKEQYLHMRCVILQFMKSLDLRGAKKETEGILAVLCDFFEYSEEERDLMLQPKPRKFLGVF